MSIRDAIGDLSITLKALSAQPRPEHLASKMASFASWFSFGERFFRQVIDVALQLEALCRAATPAEVAPLREAADECASLLSALVCNSFYAFEYIGYEVGYFYGGAPWSKLCVWRSSSEFLTALLAVSGEHWSDLDFSETVEGMELWAHELSEPVNAPAGMPSRHWWWFTK